MLPFDKFLRSQSCLRGGATVLLIRPGFQYDEERMAFILPASCFIPKRCISLRAQEEPR